MQAFPGIKAGALQLDLAEDVAASDWGWHMVVLVKQDIGCFGA